MKARLAIGIPLGMIALLTLLLVLKFIDPGHWVTGFVLSAGMGLAIFGFDRLDHIKYQDLEVKFRQVQAEVEKITALYSEGSFLPEEAFQLTNEEATMELGLGLGSGFVAPPDVMRFVSGCITRERQRLAKIFAEEKLPEAVATALVDTRFDKHVFQWAPPTVTMDQAPKQRAAPFEVVNLDKDQHFKVFQAGHQLARDLSSLNTKIEKFDGGTSTFIITVDEDPSSLSGIHGRRLKRVLDRHDAKIEFKVRDQSS